MLRGTNSVPFQTGAIFERVTPRIATSGALTIGVNEVPPMPPSEEMVKVAPCMSGPFSSPLRALADSSPISFEISTMPLPSAPLMTGTTRPFGVSAAKPMFQKFLRISLSPSGWIELLTSQCAFSADTLALIRNESMVTR